MSISIGQVQALTTKAIDNMVVDSIYKDNAYLARLKKKEKVYHGEKMTFPFNYVDDTGANGGYYVGSAGLSLDEFDPFTELSFDLKELHTTIVISSRDIARNSGKEAILSLVEQRLNYGKKNMQQLLTKGIFSDGTISTGALSADQLIGMQAFLKSSSVNYGGLTESDVSTHVASVSSNSGTNRAITTLLVQTVISSATEGNEALSLGIMRNNIMIPFLELLKPYQRITNENSLSGLGHNGNILFYSGVDFIVDNLCEANAISFLNEKYVNLYSHPDYNMVRDSFDKLENQDGIAERIKWKGVYACNVLRYQGKLDDITNA